MTDEEFCRAVTERTGLRCERSGEHYALFADGKHVPFIRPDSDDFEKIYWRVLQPAMNMLLFDGVRK